MGKTCGFFGNASLWEKDKIADKLRPLLIDLITNKNVDTFYVGVKGEFDILTHQVVARLCSEYPHIKIMLVISYMKDRETLLR